MAMWLSVLLLCYAGLSNAAEAGEEDWESMLQAGRSLVEQGRYQEAAPKLSDTLRRIEAQGLQGYPVVITHSNLATCYQDLGKYLEAETHHRRAVREGEALWGASRLALAVALNNYGVLLNRLGRLEQAGNYFERSLEIRRQLLGPRHTAVARQHHNMARLYVERGELDRAEPLYREAIGVWEQDSKSGADLAAGLSGLATLYSQRGDLLEALALAERAVNVWEKAVGREHPTFAALLNNLATVHIELERYDRAGPLVEQALDIARQTYGEHHPETATILINHSVVLKHTERKQQARLLRKRAHDILSSHAQQNFLHHTVDASQLLREVK